MPHPRLRSVGCAAALRCRNWKGKPHFRQSAETCFWLALLWLGKLNVGYRGASADRGTYALYGPFGAACLLV